MKYYTIVIFKAFILIQILYKCNNQEFTFVTCILFTFANENCI
jgi:hypothetical protein